MFELMELNLVCPQENHLASFSNISVLSNYPSKDA